ncbi:CRISPR-associated protein Cas4 [Dissulfurimicrobium hydrothermale]|uniref:CRISPR-associated protein Cas4 n=1 Tax=Dissulfurimicrobium hydrothermale TaxID=1750598 RepID=UPI001EDBF926|nr:CRISPR-associated protein Cas4 [Dissulfurimicrobium hydrothermale]UKL14244.1 CRISPR-associated protein Cas4 [Dissulfurimicrobium hydrothermale]
MKLEYTPDDLLPLSGIQHFLFCRRQWALIYVEMQWKENVLTAEGRILHQRVDDPFFTETRNGVIIARSVPVASYRLGLSGVCDVVEFTPSPPAPLSQGEEDVKLPNRAGLYLPTPVEYKRGKPKREPMDEAQLCAQAMCLEEMLSTHIPLGYLYYGQTHHREKVEFTSELRALVMEMSAEMHQYFQRGHTLRVKPSKACRSCSLEEVCLPVLQKKVIMASKYIRQQVESA